MLIPQDFECSGCNEGADDHRFGDDRCLRCGADLDDPGQGSLCLACARREAAEDARAAEPRTKVACRGWIDREVYPEIDVEPPAPAHYARRFGRPGQFLRAKQLPAERWGRA